MTKYIFVYHGGGMPEDPQQIEEVMQAWGNWFTELGEAVVDAGNPAGSSLTVMSNGEVQANGGSNPVSGYSLVNAESEEQALEYAKGCPILAAGGQVEVAPAIELSE